MAGLNRRQFLAAGALATLGTAGIAVERQGRLRTPEKPWNASTGRAIHKFRDGVPTACTGCEAGCALVAYRDGDRVVQLGPNAEAGPLSALCAKAYENLEALYDPERVLKPLRRKGPRGGGEWQEITWAEAATLIAQAVAADPAAVYADVGRPDPLAGPILEALGVKAIIAEAADRQWSAREAQRAVYGVPLGRPDYAKARTILLLGARPLDDGPAVGPAGRDLVAAKARGTTVISVGAYQGATGSFADEWIAIRPGTEAVVALGLLREVLSAGGKDAQAVSRYTPEVVESTAGIPVARFVRLARRLATQGPALVVTDSAGSRQGQTLEAAAAALNSLGGSPAAVGVQLDRRPAFAPDVKPTMPRAAALKEILGEGRRAGLYLAYRTNPVYSGPQSDLVRKAFADEGKIGLLVAMDTQLTETASVADLVLPAATDLELWNLLGGYAADGSAYAVLQQPVTRRLPEPTLLTQPGAPVEKLFDAQEAGPVGQARQLGDVLLDVLGSLQHPARARFPYADSGAFVRTAAAPLAGGKFEALAHKGFASGLSEAGGPKQGSLQLAGKLGLEAPAETAREGTSFALVLLRYPELAPAYANSRWGREIRYRNPLLMNAAVARKLGLREGDRVLLRTQTGEAHAEVLPIQGIHPEAVALAEDFGHWAGGVAATAQKKETGDRPKSPLVSRKNFLSDPLGVAVQGTAPGEVPWWSHHGAGVSTARLTPLTFDASGAQAWKEIRVAVRRG
ncbi:MAG: molybdopterin-dependent oxidoreductase [Deltaproteobacteria bacterium]|nr:molybdopterin-dependent oxidoreductase [Deltaproteobacteria bacterium]